MRPRGPGKVVVYHFGLIGESHHAAELTHTPPIGSTSRPARPSSSFDGQGPSTSASSAPPRAMPGSTTASSPSGWPTRTSCRSPRRDGPGSTLTIDELILAYWDATSHATTSRMASRPASSIRIRQALRLRRSCTVHAGQGLRPFGLEDGPAGDDRPGLVPDLHQQASQPGPSAVRLGRRQELLPGEVHQALTKCQASRRTDRRPREAAGRSRSR